MNESHTRSSGACWLAGRSKRILLAVAATAALAVLAGPAAAHEYILNMSGDQEVPGPGDPDGIATGTIYVEPLNQGVVAWNITYTGIAAPTQMHIHTGAAGAAGPVLVNLGVVTSGGPGTLIGNTTTSAAIAQMIVANSTGFYVDIHNASFLAGAVRGQIEPQPLVHFHLDMDGAQEVPDPGDVDGTAGGTITVDNTVDEISWNFTYENIEAPLQMHIHTGAAGVAGPVFVDLGVATSGGSGTLIGSTVLNPGTINLLLANPPGYYVDIHNASFPHGAVRGQLLGAPGEASPGGDLLAARRGSSIEVDFEPACGATDHAAYWGVGPIDGALEWIGSGCGLGISGSASFDPGAVLSGQVLYFVVVGYDEDHEGGYGADSASAERPEAVGIGACDRVHEESTCEE